MIRRDHSELYARLLYGQQIGAQPLEVARGLYRLTSPNSGRTYEVKLLPDGYDCSCPAHMTPDRACYAGALCLYDGDILFWHEVEAMRRAEHLARGHAAENEAFEQVLVERLAIYAAPVVTSAPF